MISKCRADLILASISAVVTTIFIILVLYNMHKIPALLSAVLTSLGAMLVVVPWVLQLVGKADSATEATTVKQVWKQAHRYRSIVTGMLFPCLVGYLVWFVLSATPHSGITTLITPIPLPSATPTSTPQPPWTTALQQIAPGCNNPLGTKWNDPLPGTKRLCQPTGTLLQQTNGNYYAELDLDAVDGKTYSQIKENAQVQVTFLAPTDEATFATLVMQTPATPGKAGGYQIELYSSGNWSVEQVTGPNSVQMIDSGHVTIDPSKPVTLGAEVYGGWLYPRIAGTQTKPITDTLDPAPGAVALIVGHTGAVASSPVRFSGFKLHL